MNLAPNNRVIIGILGKPYGLSGWQSFHPQLEEPLSLSDYKDVAMRPKRGDKNAWQTVEVQGIKRHGKGFLIKLKGSANPEEATQLRHYELGIMREELPPPTQGSYYWHDLIGSQVINTYDGKEVLIGTISFLQRAGGKDVMVIKNEDDEQESYIPFVQPDFVTHVDLRRRQVRVLWDPNF